MNPPPGMAAAGRREPKLSRGRARRLPGRIAPVVLAALALLVGGATAGPVAAGPPPPRAPSAIIIDRVTGRVLYGKGIHQERPPASTTKIMTALLVIQRSRDLDRTITAPATVASITGIGLRPGERITIRQALLGLVLKSAQDCGVTLATAMAGSEPVFVGWMNAKARTLGLADTHYVNCNGNHRDPSHHTSVFDLARLGRYAMRNADFRDIVGLRYATVRWGAGRHLEVRAHNPLFRMEWADGIKSGLTDAAGFCLVGSGQPGLRPFVTATLKSPSREREGRDHLALFEWASALYAEKTVVHRGTPRRRGADRRRRRGSGHGADDADRRGAPRGAHPARADPARALRLAAGGRDRGRPGRLPRRRSRARHRQADRGDAAVAVGEPVAGARGRYPLTAASVASTMPRSSARTSSVSGSGR